jgi:hypothetical protein
VTRDEQAPREGDIRWAESGEIVVFDGNAWHPIRRLPADAPVVFRNQAADRADSSADGDDNEGSSTMETDA